MVNSDGMTTYVIGAGASHHAGYPLCSQLWAAMLMWVIESCPLDSEYRQGIDTVTALHGPVSDTEAMFTDLDLGGGTFQALTEDQRIKLEGKIRRCLRDYFTNIAQRQSQAPQYEALASRMQKGDTIITFNYDVALENELIRAHKFSVSNGYGFEGTWDEPESDIKVLKLHGSINWIGVLFGGITRGYSAFTTSLGTRPFVDNVDGLLNDYPDRVLDTTFPGGGVTGASTTLVLPTYDKKYSVETSVGDEWTTFYDSIWSQAFEALQRSDKITVIGYSVPEADHRARALLLWNNNKQALVSLCCASSNGYLKREFERHGFWRVNEIGSFESAFQ